MEMLNIIGHLEDLDFVSRELVLLECIHMVNAQHEIVTNNFTISTTEKNMDALVDVCFIKPYRKAHDTGSAVKQLDRLIKAFDMDDVVIKRDLEEHFDIRDTIARIDEVYAQVADCLDRIDSLEDQLCKNRELMKHFHYLKDIPFALEELNGLEYFDFKVGILSRENAQKLHRNYENVPAIIYQVYSQQNSDVIISIAPKSLKIELERILSSLSFREIEIPGELKGTPAGILDELDDSGRQIAREIRNLKQRLTELKEQHGPSIRRSISRMKAYEKMLEINNETACSNDFFYMAGWIPVREKARLEERLKPVIDRTLLFFKSTGDVGKDVTPPTRLRNSVLVRPFEALVGMYGLPSYNELDPTSFVGLSYMLLFGLMFGDVGQGLIFLLAGLFLSRRKNRPNMGGVLSRIGLSSMVFGALYGSVFGFEELIPALLIRPMENINVMLISAIVLGVVILTVAFIYNLINALKHRNVEEGLLGRNGIAGLLFYWTLLIVVLLYVRNGSLPLPLPSIILILGLLMGLIVIKHPLANWLTKKRPLYNEPVADYYIEGGFGIVETLLSMLSNTISFIRVGAFALNHVGLFIAFLTMAEMIRSSAGSIIILIIGNLVIIGLEGLIVFIQGLRLEYYEVFSKFYSGNGIPYRPVALRYGNLEKKHGGFSRKEGGRTKSPNSALQNA